MKPPTPAGGTPGAPGGIDPDRIGGSPELAIDPETPRDQDAIREVHERAFGRSEEARIVARVRRTERFVPELSLVARSGGVVVGHALFSRIDVRPAAAVEHDAFAGDHEAPLGEHGRPVVVPAGGSRRVLALGPVGVEPRRQRQGIGTALINYGLEAIARAGEGCVVVLGDPAYYGRFGFAASERFGVRPFWHAMMVLDLGGASALRGGEIAYPDAFADDAEVESETHR